MEETKNNDDVILSAEDVRTTFHHHGTAIQAVRGVSFSVNRQEILAVVGESGSGKSVLMKSVMGLMPENADVSASHIRFLGHDRLKMTPEQLRKMRGKDMAMIFQDPMTALNPLRTIGYHLTEVLKRHRGMDQTSARQEAVLVLEQVGIPSPEKRLNQYPHEFSGGMRQRVLIAMALCCRPKLLIADEPTTALDVTIQAQILELLQKIQEETGMSIVLITHDLGVVASLSHRIEVMYGGLIMETGVTDEIFYNPSHPYTRALLHAVPNPGRDARKRLEPIPGMAPSLADPPPGCPFSKRCKFACGACDKKIPDYKVYSNTQKSLCIFTSKELDEMERKGT
ncbi:ABC transporter ATP-binding protein [Clostridium sp. E02]|uniref:ABC transporter ATP-binding protein n=1 Tax=Clostridium sp. E02 TaxID=2487134 RepID=UPI000F51C33A|nr:ABC transporter ATP-binding protein [Clostridium sp. E02]